jgi:hypothetical protein
MSSSTEDQFIWVIKDNKGCFASRNSISKIKHGWLYISFKTFSEECRWYISKESAEKALNKLRKMNLISELNINFQLEFHNLDKLIAEHNAYQGENMVVCEHILRLTEVI